MKKLIIFGGTGFIGKHLTYLLEKNYEIIIPSRNPEKHKEKFNNSIKLVKTGNPEILLPFFEKAYGIINLAGENVGGRWTKTKKDAIYKSRLQTDLIIYEIMKNVKNSPQVIIQGSGIGVYGTNTSNKPITEESPLGTSGFLTKTGIDHEKAFDKLKDKTQRVIFLRTGLVLDKNEGSLPQFLLPFRFFIGGKLGNGKQWISWITIEDEINAIRFLLENNNCKGAYNLTSPQPIRQKDMAIIIGKLIHKPALMSTPSFILQFIMKEMANELILNGKYILPKQLLNQGFVFRYQNMEQALKAIL